MIGTLLVWNPCPLKRLKKKAKSQATAYFLDEVSVLLAKPTMAKIDKEIAKSMIGRLKVQKSHGLLASHAGNRGSIPLGAI